MATNDSIRLSSDTSKAPSDKGKRYTEKGPAMGYARETREWFAQKYYTRPPLNIAFESAQLTYSDLPVDLYNTGVNQILSVAAGRGHQLPHPVTFAADNLENALDAIRRLPRADGSFVLKDRYGYGCGAQVHRLRFDAPGLEQRLSEYIETYGNILLQEYCPEIEHGDIVVTFFDDELIGALRRLPEPGQWKTNASLGAREVGCNLTARQESIARALKRSFPECRLVSVDLLESGKILEINAFPGGRGLLKNYGIALGEIVMDRLERELMGKGAELSAPSALSWSGAEKSFPTGTHWPDIEALYSVQQGTREVFDVLSGDRYHLDIRDLIRFEARSPEYILSIPHAGVFVPESHRNRFRLNEKSLIEIDLYSDLLYETSEGLQVHSELAPFFVDMNRDREGSKEENLPCHLTNPAHEYYDINDRLVLERPYMPKDRENVLAYYDLYHDLLAALIERMKRERGYALLFDCHSMTAVGQGRARDKGQSRANFVVGTLAGSSAHQRIIETFSSTLEQQIRPHGLGLSVARDVPYAGGFITRKHHNPRKHVHVIQIEVSMDTYMYEAIVDEFKRYALKKPRLRIVRNAVRNAFRAACEAAECIYRKEETSSDANA